MAANGDVGQPAGEPPMRWGAAVLVLDGAGRVQYASPSASQLLRRTVVGEVALTVLAVPEDQPVLRSGLANAAAGRPWVRMLRVAARNGGTLWVTLLPGSGTNDVDQHGPLAGPIVPSAERAGSGQVLCLLHQADSTAATTDVDDPTHGHLTALSAVTAELAGAETVEEVTAAVIRGAADAVDADMASLCRLEEDSSVRLLGLRAEGLDVPRDVDRYPLTMNVPSAEVIRSGQRLFVADPAEPGQFDQMPAELRHGRSILGLPLRVGARVTGAVVLSFAGYRPLTSIELDYLGVLADTCAQALERVAATEHAAQRTTQLAFLANASTELASSLDYETTLANVARLAVPALADWCAIDLVRDGHLHRLAVAHTDPAKVRLAEELFERMTPQPDDPAGPWAVIRTGQSHLISHITQEMLEAFAVTDEAARVARELQLNSSITVPINARGRVLGALSWVMAESGRRYSERDVAVAEDLAKLGGMAIDNADVYSQTRQAAVHLQQAVLPSTLPQPPGWQVHGLYLPAGRSEVGGDFYDVMTLPDGRLVFFIGDVMGRGVQAATLMARTTASVRAYATVDPDPSTVLGKLDTMFAAADGDELITMVYMLVDVTGDWLHVGNAGHLPPHLLRTGEVVALPTGGPPLGLSAHRPSHASVALRRGDVLVAFTDGLMERRGEDLDSGLARVRAALPQLLDPRDVRAVLPSLVAELRDPSREDDVAVLTAHRL